MSEQQANANNPSPKQGNEPVTTNPADKPPAQMMAELNKPVTAVDLEVACQNLNPYKPTASGQKPRFVPATNRFGD